MKIVVKIISTTLLVLSANLLLAQLCTDNGNVWNKSWESCQESSNPNPARGTSHWLSISFDQLENIDSTHIWNANISGESKNGVKSAIIDYTTDGDTWIELGTFTFPKADESQDYSGFEGPNFGGIWVKEIVFTAVETYAPAEDCVALAEVQIKLNPDACYGTIDICGRCDGKGEITWYQDADGNGLGDPTAFVTACAQPDGFVDNKDDTCDNGLLSWHDIGPLFQNNGCNGCHGSAGLGGLNLETYENFQQGGNKCGSNITTGNTLTEIIQTDGYSGCGNALNGQSMNARVGFQMDATEITTIQQWIDEGAVEDCRCAPAENYALSGTPSMSSQNSTMNASNLIDQVINNVNNQLAHTKGTTPHEWVQIDLGLIHSVSNIIIKNRTNCCSERLSNAYVLTSKNPFPDNTNLDEALANAEFIDQLGDTEGISQLLVPIYHSTRYIRVQKSGDNPGGNPINLREIEIYSGVESMDSDNDGTCDAVDICKDLNNNLIGTACDDGKECTENDIYTDACTCAGTPKTDSDNDGVCDALDVVPLDPCTADGTYDGVEPADWLYINGFDCDGDGITSSQYDTDDFDGCQDQQGFRATSECACPNDINIAGFQLISASGVGSSANAGGLPDSLTTANVAGLNDKLIFKTGYLLKGEEVCFAIGFNNNNGAASITINGYYFRFQNNANIINYGIQEVCYPVQVEGEQTIVISENGGGNARVDGGYYEYCECGQADPQNYKLDCRCPDSKGIGAADIVSSNNVNNANNANGLPDGIFTGPLAGGNQGAVTYEIPDLKRGDQLCVTMKFNHAGGKLRSNLNGRHIIHTPVNVNESMIKCLEVYEDGLQTLVLLDNGGGQSFIDGISIESCMPCIDIDLHANMEGPYNSITDQMNTILNTRGILPGQTPISPIATPTLAGQPYHTAPWNYSGTEGAGWTDADYEGTEVDWVMVSFRTGITSDTEIARVAALINKDGSISFADRCVFLQFVSSVYIVLEHRNHIGVMTPQPIDIVNGTLTYDFRIADSYRDATSFGQKQLSTGEWAMFAGDADQSDLPSFDIFGSDKVSWFENNGVFDGYMLPDFNLDGDVNGQDKVFWFENNGISSRVPK